MKAISSAMLTALAIVAAAPATGRPPSPAVPLKLEKVVMLMRHGIRPPTKANPLPKGYTDDKWPGWSVDYGLLTERGAAGVKLLGAADRAYFQGRGLIGGGCPAAGEVALQASGKARAVSTAESWRDGFMPGCQLPVGHPGEDDPDPVFHGFDDKPASFDGEQALRDAQAMAPAGGIAAELTGYRDDLSLLARVLRCPEPGCPLLTGTTRLVARPHQRPDWTGPADVASTASQSILLEYLEGKPMAEVGWGRVTRAQIEELLRFHPLKFKYANRPPYVAARAAGPLAVAMVKAMTAPGTHLALFAGHDTNIADLGGLLGLHWHVPSYPTDDIPPGSALGFEVLKNAAGTRYVRAFYRSQTMDQLREQRALTGGEAPYRAYLPIPDCGNTAAATGCPLIRFVALVRARARS